jgi:coenzyme F420-0:L-glutamate ligase
VTGSIEVLPVTGLPEVRPGDDLAAQIVACAPWLRDDDILVVTSKVVSKAEGALISLGGADPARREGARQQAITDETVRLVARRGPLRIVETRHGLVLAAAGVDGSNVAADELALLPRDPDGSANRIRAGVAAATGRRVAVIVSDSIGRPWRHGITDVAIGSAGLAAVLDVRGQDDRHGNTLTVTEVAQADEIAGAGDLVKGKLDHTPVAVVRGLRPVDDGLGTSRLIRGSGEDLFRLGTNEAIELGRRQATIDSGGPDANEAASSLRADAAAVISALDLPRGSSAAAIREAFLALLAARPDATQRSCVPGHVTASAVILDHECRRALLTLHPRVGAWLQLGGHIESDDLSILAAAEREAAEEAGFAGTEFDPVPIDLDIHPITCSLGLPTRHFDVSFAGRAPRGAAAVISAESDDLRWFDVDALPPDAAPEVFGLVELARRRLKPGLT